MVESTLARMQKFSQQNNLSLEANLLKPPPEQSFWVTIIGRGYPPPNRTFRSESTLARMQKFSQQNNLSLEANLLKPPPEQSFWVTIIGRGYPPPNRTF